MARIAVATAVLIATLAFSANSASAHNWSSWNQWQSGHSQGWHGWHGSQDNYRTWIWHWLHNSCSQKPTPVAEFSSTAGELFPGDVVTFDASASDGGSAKNSSNSSVNGVIDQYDWDFGDGNAASSSEPTTTHAYSAPGVYNVKLTVTNDADRTASVTHTVTINGLPVPTAALSVTPSTPIAGQAAQFDGSTSTGGESHGRVGTVTRYDWDYGDGSSDADAGATPSHTYTTSGTFTATLTVTNNDGQTDTETLTVPVDPAISPQPTADFGYQPLAPVAQRDVTFDASASTGGVDRGFAGTITSYTWNFGDGQTATSASPTVVHNFAAGDTYSVTLTATNDYGNQAWATKSVSVAPPPPPIDPGEDPRIVSPSTRSAVTQSSRASGTQVALVVSYAVPDGVDSATACTGGADVVASAGKLSKRGKSTLSASGGNCQAQVKLKLPKGFRGKKTNVAVSFGGNGAVAPWSLSRKVFVK